VAHAACLAIQYINSIVVGVWCHQVHCM